MSPSQTQRPHLSNQPTGYNENDIATVASSHKSHESEIVGVNRSNTSVNANIVINI
jgi:hypothetical protein